MIVTVKTLKRDVLTVDVPLDCTVSQLKNAICAERPDWQGRLLHVICAGKILVDDLTAAFDHLAASADHYLVAMFKTAPASSPVSTSAPAAEDGGVAQTTDLMKDMGVGTISTAGSGGGDDASGYTHASAAGSSSSCSPSSAAAEPSARVARASAVASGLVADEAQLAKLRRMPEVQALL